MKKIKLKSKNLASPWITRGIIKSSKRKQKLYEKYLKRKTREMKVSTKIIKDFLNPLNIGQTKLF